jgi:hypothetical protein
MQWRQTISGLFFLSISSQILFAQSSMVSHTLLGAMEASQHVGNQSPFMMVTNPSSLSRLENNYWGLAAAKKNALPGWIEMQAVGMITTKSGNWGLSFSQAGMREFNNSKISFLHARELASGIRVGVCMGVVTRKAAGYKNNTAPLASLGALLSISRELMLGITASGIFYKTEINSSSVQNLQLQTSLHYEPSNKFSLSFWALKKQGPYLQTGSSLHYRIQPSLSVVLGISMNPQWGWLAVEFAQRKIRWKIMMGWHPQLGITNGIALWHKMKTD